jgi:AmmeMemoRadiSam system protein B
MSPVRQPAVAGRFYPSDPARLDREVAEYLAATALPVRALALIAPHAGYMFSGRVAGATYARAIVPRTAVILCPNHTGMGSRRSIWISGAWQIPGAKIPIDADLAESIRREGGLQPDQLAHQAEHAIEVQLPFLRARNPQVSLVPICLAHLTPLECIALGEAIASAVHDRQQEVLLVASTDMSHYLPADQAKELDDLALQAVRAMDPEGLYRTVQEHDISMCGFIPTAAVLAAARALGAKSAELVRYGNSGEASGDDDRVVGYAGLVVPAG